MSDFTHQKERAQQWFETLRDKIRTAFLQVEEDHKNGPFSDKAAGMFEIKQTRRNAPDGSDAGGGVMSVMRNGRVFEKVGINISTVYGTLSPTAQAAMAERKSAVFETDARFWASGISLVAHMQNPHVPAVHMNTRLFWTPHAWWFGGGMDLNPCIEYPQDTSDFHTTLKATCDAHDAEYYEKFKAWADSYFYIPHRQRARGVGGIFYDDLNTGDWEADFAFTQSVGRAFLKAFLPLITRRVATPWAEQEKNAQLEHRGLYAEYNLVYDRGTKFGLSTGHDAEAVLMSLPPMAKWV